SLTPRGEFLRFLASKSLTLESLGALDTRFGLQIWADTRPRQSSPRL
ncbi:hypothetical protein scyTo_0022627, partial [Scyliorhinus torazame]|nr:hypothetical protein [Scyliorhinus torazame]